MTTMSPSGFAAMRAVALEAIARKDLISAELHLRAATTLCEGVEAHVLLAKVLFQARRFEDAAEVVTAALAREPTHLQAGMLNAQLLMQGRRFADARDLLTRLHDAHPTAWDPPLMRAAVRRMICDWSAFDADVSGVLTAVKQGVRMSPLHLMAFTDNLELQRRCAQTWAPRSAFQYAHPPGPSRSGPLRVGYISGDFQEHATSYLVSELFEQHDRSRVEVVLFSYGADLGGPARARVQASADLWIDLEALDDDAAAAAVNAANLDLLIDLKGYAGGARPEILARRPAAIQVNYLGFPGTMGADFIDYVITDEVVAPSEMQRFSREEIIHLPTVFQPNDRRRRIGEPVSRETCGLPDGVVVFGSFNDPGKVTPPVFAVWMELLRATPGSVLWFYSGTPLAVENVQREAEALGVEPHRIVAASYLPQAEHLARLSHVDVALDCTPAGAFTTASDALWVGVPMVTLLGQAPSGRGAASLLRASGTPELVASDLTSYRDIAHGLAADPIRRDALRAKLRAARETGPVFDTLRTTRALEDMYDRLIARCAAPTD